ncbi:HEAT repeat domain-containing protein [Merismopedia glauca]|uniref:Glycosyl transferase family 2 n=1 Tax=Merismopedia glauca CCAP 1448/3 TaxID=1296344 RepID=A0A2T1C2M1_9CYAN|nr:HEAT repeat domain-containing protein [Merismopedia glauca]PSB02397.1 glycosyl transferase family 2 [Merismopedia glauca CCAP 1448/3]
MSNALNWETKSVEERQADNDALIEMVTDQITLDTFDTNNREILNRMVVEGMADPRGMVRLRFAETLGEIGEPATPFLLQALKSHTNPVVRRAAAKTLTLIADPTAIPILLEAFLTDEDTVVKGSSAGALARIGKPAVPILLDILGSPEHPESIKGHAAWALAFIGSEASEYLYEALNSDSVDVRCAVVGAIAHVAQERADEKSCQVLVSALSDPAAVIRTEAAAALAQLNYPPAVPHLIAALQDPDGEVRKAAVTSLGKIGASAALEPLKACLKDDLESIRLLAKLAISQIENR